MTINEAGAPRAPRGKLVGAPATNLVLVTGCPRSGTTFLGKALSSPRNVDYFHEPLNPSCGLPSVTTDFVDIGHPSNATAQSEFRRLLRYEPMLTTGNYRRDSSYRQLVKRVVGSRGPFMLRLARLNPWSEHAVVKDPFAALSVRWLRDEAGLAPIVILRHPAAVAESFRRLGWQTDGLASDLARRDGLMSDREREIADSIADELSSAALIWRVLVRHMLETPSLRVTHEALSDQPRRVVRALCDATGLPYTARTERFLGATTTLNGKPATAETASAQSFRRHSGGIFAAAIDALTSAELDRIWEITGDLAHEWYEPAGVIEGTAVLDGEP
ncbi:MAG: sulfotransferase [Ilumatobacter sp.]|uniref:sulfotransferase n=1 Tax=Ilumatobacter sp. TaxID=1967498 RepID=UPI002607829B|nr:sulfotransferase [Ilumatobacter sp.]MDJ0768717.1 sulfotransferase [Ilumatobacter sp.]